MLEVWCDDPRMSYTAILAIFPAWKAPVPLNTIGTFATFEEAATAGLAALVPIAERELSNLSDLNHVSAEIDGGTVVSIKVPEGAVHGYLIYDVDGVEISNWTTLDIAVERAALRAP